MAKIPMNINEPNMADKSLVQADPMAQMDTRMMDNRSAAMAPQSVMPPSPDNMSAAMVTGIDPRYREYR
jgi:hypothetical protein